MFELNINIVINSKKEIFIFRLTNDGEINYTIFDSSLTSLSSKNLYDKNILKYSVIIDKNDVMHLVALLNTGELNYYKYMDEKWVKATIAKFDMISNIYNQIEILMIKNKLHIIYNYSNLINSNIWTIQHVIYGDEEKHNAIRYISKRIPDPFAIDVDNQGTIHLLYRNNINKPQIYHIFYSHYTKAWSPLSKQISSETSQSSLPFLFIDSQDNLHGLWLEEIDGKYQIRYLKMSSGGKEKYIWKEIKLPYIQLSKYPPIIFEENNKLKLIFTYNDNIDFLYSSNFGNSWLKGENSQSLSQNTILAKVRSNINKINYIYCNISEEPKLHFLDSFPDKKIWNTNENLKIESENKTELSDSTNKEDFSISESEEVILETSEINSNILDELENKFIDILDNYKAIESTLIKILNNQETIKNELNNIQNSINQKKDSFFNKFFN
ncbi:hypothetical protein [Tissierella praeacuta]|uniref:hypothetical protein n=1 Tax=Tissierella praeacuta TaxID=43131 RepID=UPI00334069C2